MSERPRWKVNVKSLVGNALCDPDDPKTAEVFFEPQESADPNTGKKRMGQVGPNLSPLNDAAQAIIDEQDDDHPDATANAGKRARAAAKAAAEDQVVEDETNNGPAPRKKGDTRTAAKKAPKAAKKAEEPAQDPEDGKEPPAGGAEDADEEIA